MSTHAFPSVSNRITRVMPTSSQVPDNHPSRMRRASPPASATKATDCGSQSPASGCCPSGTVTPSLSKYARSSSGSAGAAVKRPVAGSQTSPRPSPYVQQLEKVSQTSTLPSPSGAATAAARACLMAPVGAQVPVRGSKISAVARARHLGGGSASARTGSADPAGSATGWYAVRTISSASTVASAVTTASHEDATVGHHCRGGSDLALSMTPTFDHRSVVGSKTYALENDWAPSLRPPATRARRSERANSANAERSLLRLSVLRHRLVVGSQTSETVPWFPGCRRRTPSRRRARRPWHPATKVASGLPRPSGRGRARASVSASGQDWPWPATDRV